MTSRELPIGSKERQVMIDRVKSIDDFNRYKTKIDGKPIYEGNKYSIIKIYDGYPDTPYYPPALRPHVKEFILTEKRPRGLPSTECFWLRWSSTDGWKVMVLTGEDCKINAPSGYF